MNNANNDPCANVFSDGLRFRWDDFSNSPYKSNFSCKLQTTDGRFIKISIPEGYNLIGFLNSFPSYNETELIEQNGLFTWIFYSMGSEQPIQFAAVAVKNAFEVGTLHKALALKMGAVRIHGAGELQKNGNEIKYNLQSGSFTKFWLNSREKSRKRLRCTSDELENKIDLEFKKRFTDPITLVKNKATMITEEIPVTNDDIDFYRNAGLAIDLFDTKEACTESFSGGGGKRRITRRRKSRKSRKSKRVT